MAFLTVSETAELLVISRAAVYQAVAAERLKSEKRYGKVVISEKEVDRYKATVGVRNGYVNRGKQAEEGAGQ